MDVYIQSEIGVCKEFKSSTSHKKEEISVVISPLRVQGDDTGMNLRIINGCNMWRSCCNSKCFFSQLAREAPKIKSSK